MNDVDGELWLAAVQQYAVDTPEFIQLASELNYIHISEVVMA